MLLCLYYFLYCQLTLIFPHFSTISFFFLSLGSSFLLCLSQFLLDFHTMCLQCLNRNITLPLLWCCSDLPVYGNYSCQIHTLILLALCFWPGSSEGSFYLTSQKVIIPDKDRLYLFIYSLRHIRVFLVC